ncbi:hypothetical protein DPSP01_008429 [Paraphaeosphaeria sporulosa]
MATLSSVLTVALLALGGVDAKRKDKVSYSRYLARDCNGHPLSGDIDDLQLKGGASGCKQIEGQGVRFHMHKKDKYNKWIDDVNRGLWECGATVYRGVDCVLEDIIDQVSLPQAFNECNPLHADAGSISFWCRPNYGYQGIAQPREMELPVTSYSIDKYGKAHPSMYTTVINATQHIYNPLPEFTGITPPVTVTATKILEISTKVNTVPQVETTTTVAVPKVNARAEPAPKVALEPRGKQYNVKGVWMRHPWGQSAICFKCWTRKEMDFGKFKCRSGNYDKYDVPCPPVPNTIAPTTTVDITHTRTVEFWRTEADHFSLATQPSVAAEKRSPHKAVVFHNPYFPDLKVCADAEWENSGKPKAEVRLQKIKSFDKCAKKDPMYIDIGIPEQTRIGHTYVTSSITHTTRPVYAGTNTVTTTKTIIQTHHPSITFTATITQPVSPSTKVVLAPGSTTTATIVQPLFSFPYHPSQ